jgi:hypothetical protein
MPTSHGDQPATRADVRALEVKVEGRLQQFEDKMDRRFAELKDEIIRAIAQSQAETLERTQEMVRDAQTELLRGFNAFVERRLLEIEPRLPPSPPQPPAA